MAVGSRAPAFPRASTRPIEELSSELFGSSPLRPSIFQRNLFQPGIKHPLFVSFTPTMFIAPAIVEARDASNAARRSNNKEIEARQVRPPGATTPAQEDDDGDIISMILSGIFGIGDEETSTTTKPRSTSTRTSTTSTTRSTSTTATSTRSTPTVLTPLPTVADPTPSPSSSTPRSTTLVTQTVDGSANNAASTPSKPNSGLPSVVIGVIVAAAVIFGLIFIALIARKVFQAKRRRRRATWADNGGISPFQDPLVREKALPPPPAPETQDYASYPAYPPPAVTFANQPAPYSPAAASSAGFPAPYPFGGAGNGGSAKMNANTPTAAMFQSSSAYTPADLAGPVVIQQTPPTPMAGSPTTTAMVQLSVVTRTFIPSLPDELSIATGEQVRVLSFYDDGWALCEKMTGEKGVVPQECLESAQSTTSNTPAQQLAGSEESARLNRNSSLRRGQDQTY